MLSRKKMTGGGEERSGGGGQRSFNFRTGSIEQTGDSSSGSSDKLEIKLFGSWQTQPMEVPPVLHGVIPMNEYGNLEVWDGAPAFVPKGAAFVDHPKALKAAKNLGIQCVPAVVGFESRGVHMVPRVGGVVVLRDCEQLVLDAALCLEAHQEEGYYQKREKLIYGRWRKLIASALSRQGLLEKYGH